MKVLQINSVCGIGSTGRIATDIHNILIEQGHESYIAYGRDLPKNCDNAIKIGTKIDNYTHVAKTRVLDKHGFGSKQATIEFIGKVKELDPDIIHLHNIHGYYMNVEILFNYLKEANKPVVWTLHDCWSFTGHCAYFDYVGCDKWKTGCDSCPEKKAYPSSLIFDNSKNNYINKKEIFTGVKNLTIVTPSQWLANLVQESFLNEYPVKVINNGIDLNTFRPNTGDFRNKFNLNGKFIILGVASVWDRRKGLKYFVELADMVSEDEVIVLVGLSEKQINQIPENIIGITRTNNVEELVDLYSSADVFVNPTLEDNFPTTNLEALACGTPVITFDTGGSPESVNIDTGYIVLTETSDDIYSHIIKIKSNTKYNYRKNCSFRAKNKYDKIQKFIKYIELYKMIG
ncbi:glycosyltransferase family 4 protein [Fundicoccus sp. Sow4_F4]|uniref:glycosyltransferase family 4 protein n=1 Tax=Fundicoccus sp. Sow4_F4 TaxID=3438783 RepID=UPI003F8FED74